MDCRNAVGAVSPRNGQIRHPHLPCRCLLDQAHPLHPAAVSRVALANFIQKPAVDLVNDREQAGAHQLKETDGPVLQCLREHSVIGVGQRAEREVPCLVPAQSCLVEQNAHQLGNGHRRMRIIHLNRGPLGEGAPVGIGPPKAGHDIGERTAHQEVFLDKTQRLSCNGGIVRIQNPCNRLRDHAIDDCANEIAGTEFAEVEKFGPRRRPKAQRVDSPATVADRRTVVRYAQQMSGFAGHRTQCSAL
jgi:hypothetical protein